jgi:hypothetical protein
MQNTDRNVLNDLDEHGQSEDGLCQHNSSPTDEIVRRGQEALLRLRRGYEDWMAIAEALQAGRAESMRAAYTNEPKGKRYERAIGEWLLARSFHVIDKSARNHLLECLEHREAIEKWRTTLTEGERFRFNHPDTVLRRWKAATDVPDPNKSSNPSPTAKLKAEVVRLEEDNHRMRKEIGRGGGDLWSANDAADDIATVMVAKLSKDKAQCVARAILKLIKQKSASPAKPPKSAKHLTNEEVEVLFKNYRKLKLPELETCILSIRQASAHRHISLSDHQWRTVRSRSFCGDETKIAAACDEIVALGAEPTSSASRRPETASSTSSTARSAF